MYLQVWQIVASLMVAFLFGWRIGYVMGESRAWEKMDEEEEQNAGTDVSTKLEGK